MSDHQHGTPSVGSPGHSNRLGAFVTDPDASVMRRTMGRFLTGVAVVTAVDADGAPHGMTISSLQAISQDPPILMVALNFDTRTGAALASSDRFAVSILGSRQAAIAARFATRGGERFDGGEFETTPSGLPVVHGALAQAECVMHEHVVVGDHDVTFGRVVACRNRPGTPLAFYSGRFGDFVDAERDEVPWTF